MQIGPSVLTAVAAAAALIPSALGQTKVAIVSSAAKLPPLQNDGSAFYRTFRANDSIAFPFNISTSGPPKTFKTTTGIGMYGWNFLFTGSAYNPSRPLLIVLGSSATRSSDTSDAVSVLTAGMSEGWTYRIRTQSASAQSILSDAGLGVLNIVSPKCYNTTTKSPLRNACLDPKTLHSLRHYRPEVINDVLSQVQTIFGFDTSKVVGAGASMGARGIMRLGTSYPLKAASIVAGGLESNTSTFLQPSLCATVNTCGEPCWDLSLADGQSRPCARPVEDDMLLASRFTTSKVQIYASYGDSVANASTVGIPTCDAINKAATNASTSSTTTSSSTTLSMSSSTVPPSTTDLPPPSSTTTDLPPSSTDVPPPSSTIPPATTDLPPSSTTDVPPPSSTDPPAPSDTPSPSADPSSPSSTDPAPTSDPPSPTPFTVRAVNTTTAVPICQVRIKTTPRLAGTLGPSHTQLCSYSLDAKDMNYLISGYNGRPVTFVSH
ncbi:hypothetical protein OC846_003580 [Tilletia horrida]|uniref:Feruloyl esterase n=1 Tax=Tilletia horrida TaxID=155126 RepID=A0AAN6JRL3_9BASI|nr:hypothetical protein OC846_003580 [Tilletia horrida]KAK0554864.1 hypothetical protein OC845_000505 [Tilletia horrida]KAK0569598.1 hypothetical protein OC861_000778 [Tilletia horrida]